MNTVQNPLKRTFAYTEIAEHLAEKIAAGDLAPGSFLLSERKLAAIYNVNHATARKATRLLVDRGLVRKIQGRGILVTSGRQKKKSTKFIGFILCKRQKSDPFYFELITYIEKELQKYGFHLVFSSFDNAASGNQIPQMLLSSAVDGVIITGEVPKKLLNYLRQNQINHILIAHASKFDKKSNVISSDDSDIGYKAAHYLLPSHENIALIRGTEKFRPHDLIRENGFLQAFEECGRKFDKRLLVECDSFDAAEIKKKASILFEKNYPDAVFATNAQFFAETALALKNLQPEKAGQIKFVSFGNSKDFDFIALPKPVVIKTDNEEVSRAAINKLLDIINGRSVGTSINLVPAVIENP